MKYRLLDKEYKWKHYKDFIGDGYDKSMEELMNRMRVCSILFVVLKALAIILCLYSLLKCLAIAYLPRKISKNRDNHKYKTYNDSPGSANWINKNNRRRAWNM